MLRRVKAPWFFTQDFSLEYYSFQAELASRTTTKGIDLDPFILGHPKCYLQHHYTLLKIFAKEGSTFFLTSKFSFYHWQGLLVSLQSFSTKICAILLCLNLKILKACSFMFHKRWEDIKPKFFTHFSDKNEGELENPSFNTKIPSVLHSSHSFFHWNQKTDKQLIINIIFSKSYVFFDSL